ncbi:acyl-CoA carboxylase subunit beta [uncultured Flavonifractor sp.]|uniref:acyl-CoA carboxylase subunit beta n=1 Tax=uncultured Flavonifractor sp. TaxID=1193534 RepID=UPI00266EDB09|nr:acyl-CoA carboxylase subunit beta [uncultured Flavonifractor sp.]
MTTSEKIAQLEAESARVLACGGPKAVDKQHKLGKQTARERIEMLLDKGTFTEVDRFVRHRCTAFGMGEKDIPADGVVTGYGKVDGRTVFVYAQDFTAQGGSLGEMHAAKICKIMDMALAAGCPVVGLCDSGGARIQEAVDALSGYGQIFYRNARCSGRIPQISVIMGPCAGGAVYSPALTDFIIMVDKESQMFITGPSVIAATTGEEISGEELGGADTHTTVSGVAHLAAGSEEEALQAVRKLLGYLPSRAGEKPPRMPYVPADENRPELDGVIPDHSNLPYDVHDVIDAVLDPDSCMELQPWYADNIVTCFGRIGGRSVGVIANQPFSMGGSLDINASDKAARFIQLCDAFDVPLVNLVDVPGFLPGADQEHAGIIRHGAKLLYVYSVAEVPKLTVVLRKAYGGSYLAMCSKDLGADFVYAWPTAEIAVMGAAGAANVVFRKEIQAAEDPEAARAEKIELYSRQFATPYMAAARGFVDLVIHPAQTRAFLMEALELLEQKERQPHPRGNMPL